MTRLLLRSVSHAVTRLVLLTSRVLIRFMAIAGSLWVLLMQGAVRGMPALSRARTCERASSLATSPSPIAVAVAATAQASCEFIFFTVVVSVSTRSSMGR
mmetsp:Transcript_27164/g.33787  ORF Transcript_27164/g.33787 Transcript_27164/m.33787 type:complete len:100 (-) Transcript_27164:35-334(-)